MMVMQQVAQRIELRLHRDRDPNVGAHPCLASLKRGRCYSHDGIFVLIEFNCLAEDVRVRCEMRLPQAITDDCHWRTARLLVLTRKKTAPQNGLHAKYIKIICRSNHAREAHRFPIAGQTDANEVARSDPRKT